MKLSPLMLFFLLLCILVISVIVVKNTLNMNETANDKKEGFVQFNASLAPTGIQPQNTVVVPPYSSRPIIKLYDNIFFDRQNANIVEVVSEEFTGNVSVTPTNYSSSGGNVDLTGASISTIFVETRDGTINNYPVTSTQPANTKESNVASITSSYTILPYYATNCNTTGKYQLFYIPWNTDTYIHGFQLQPSPKDKTTSSFKPTNVFTYKIVGDQNSNINAIFYQENVVGLTGSSSSVTSPANNTSNFNKLYNSKNPVYQLDPTVFFDITNGNLLVTSSTDPSKFSVYNRSGIDITTSNTVIANIPSVSYSPWINYNLDNTIQIVYIPSGTDTLVVLFNSDTNGRIALLNAGRFNIHGIDVGSAVPSSTPTNPSTTPSSTSSDSAVSDYYKWYWYWNSPSQNTINTNDYMLKTQIVPPVCPSCPSTCMNTAINGTVNTPTANGGNVSVPQNNGNVISNSSYYSNNVGNTVSNGVQYSNNVLNNAVNTSGNIANNAINTTSTLLTSGASGATNLVKSGATGAVDLVESGASGATNLVKSGASGAVNLVESGATGAVNLLKSAGSGAVGLIDNTVDKTTNVLNNLVSGGNRGGSGGNTSAYYGGTNLPVGNGYSAPGFSQGAPPIDNYSYYGALPNKGSNYIPITADFSAFAK